MISNRQSAGLLLRSAISLSACIAVGFLSAGCAGHQVDKYTVTDADRAAGATAVGADGKPLPGGTGNLPRDPHDGAAFGPDGKPMGAGIPKPQ
ncbi:MAG TPA: hypothetical protein VKT77_05445 [Chthonomonadaceae bacterium]|nr:hypothetical protein [Chthonomonadaceae bacterium]